MSVQPTSMSVASLDYVRAIVHATENGVAENPTGDVVRMAFMTTSAVPAGGDWKAASWETDATTTPDTYYARALVGPTGGVITLTAGEYNVWVEVTDSPEKPVMKAGRLVAY